MKRSKIKLEQITDLENCKRAIKKASKNKRKRKNVSNVLENIDEYALKLSLFLSQEKVVFDKGVGGRKCEGTRQKEREICKPRFFPDQCAHWAIMLVLMPELDKRFYTYSCASIKGRGTHHAQRAVKKYVRDLKNSKYCLQMDVKSFYASISRDIMIDKLHRLIKDKRIVNLFKSLLAAYNGDGLPLGWYTSAPLANFYLTYIDRYIKEDLRAKRYVRYMDDSCIYAANKRLLHGIRERIEKQLNLIDLRLKRNWQIYKMPYCKEKPKPGEIYKERRRATDFVGFRFYRYKTTLRKTIHLRSLRVMRKLAKGKYTPRLARAFISYNGYLMHSDSASVRQKYIDGKINIRKIKEVIRNETGNSNSINNHAAVA